MYVDILHKHDLMRDLGKKHLVLNLKNAASSLPDSLADYDLVLSEDGLQLTYTYTTQGERTGITRLLQLLNEAGLSFKDLHTSQSSLEEIFVSLVRSQA